MRRYGERFYARVKTKARTALSAALAAAAYSRIALLQLLDVEVFAAERCLARMLGVRLEVSLVSGVAAPLAHASPDF